MIEALLIAILAFQILHWYDGNAQAQWVVKKIKRGEVRKTLRKRYGR